jgi:UDP-2,3-diacylglucosamine pyrophosphatase LpxH
MQTVTEWTPEETSKLLDIIKEHPEFTYQQIADEWSNAFTGRAYSADSVRSRVRRVKKKNIAFLDQKNAEEKDPEELLQVIIAAQKKMQEHDDRQTSVTLDVDDDKPIGIAFTGDQHIGGLYTDHEVMIRDYERLSQTDGVYTVIMGDLTDNYITRSHAGGSFEQSMTADKQRAIAEHVITKYFSDNCIAMLKGNHDNWTTKETGEDFIEYLARKIKTPYLWYGGEINVRFGNVHYMIHAHHTFKYNSSLNTTNSQRNLFAATHADIIALGHLHYNETHAKTAGGKDTVWMRTGSYKTTDDYSQYLGGLKSDPRIPMVILFPGMKKILPFRDYTDGLAHLAMLRMK